uniref:Uncharacterized protein n=1 Tax=Noctiluca scintillans TaxID=2966 RepID=A0A7S1ABP9_NOCSC|mmetsp:Transcript_39845/g.105644  ORF Transcript_39845/g.105644 Transcript_39845/m.105644 type:complete len:312 (+) Transcript_39845:54-989(+)
MPTALLEPRPVSDSLLHVIHAFAGAVGSVSSLALTYPLYSAVVRQQADHGRLDGKKTASMTLLDILWREGPTSLYQGFFQGLFATTSQSFVYYYAYDMLNSFHRVRTRPRRSAWNLVAGFEAGVVTVLLTHPLWVVNYREVTTMREASGLEGDCSIWSIFQSQGLGGLYSGVVPALMLCVSPAVQFFSLGLLFACRSYLLSRARSGSEKPLQNVELLLFGAIPKALATLVSYPLQTVKVSLSRSASSGLEDFLGVTDCVWHILQKEGFFGFFQGLGNKLLQTTCTAALLFLVRVRVQRVLTVLAIHGRRKV